MHKRLWLLWLLSISALISSAQIQSPEQFLGYKVGTRFTPHWRIVDYFKYVANSASATVKLQQYGQTNEGRPLLVVFVSSGNNISNLETIRQNNLRLAGIANGDGDNNSPALVWLSYNVHGNEPASSEAAMLTLYALVYPANTQSKAWLQNTVVAIDPCINPDGRDRYVNWYNSVVGRNFNPTQLAREHREPWPGGRSNHYNFDLNRDWAWQTQLESRQRLALYNSWLPQVHVDFHEQGYNEPYYFAPAAEPFHEVITKWQRDFQTIIGRNHARYFDQNGWLYFTKERFDLLYPSYGDTYPLYNGSIGMTYEQGGIGAGLGVITQSGDTLTLVDRVQHHFTTGISTVETASKNATALVNEFKKFYRNAKAGIGEYKSYVVKNGSSPQAKALLDLLEKNGIRYYSAKGGSSRGYNYDTGKEEGFETATGDVVVPSAQPKSTLLKVLFEPKSVLTDSATYDITAWSLPYVYGVRAYASRNPIAFGEAYTTAVMNDESGNSNYGWILPWKGMDAVKLVSQLLQKGVRLRFATAPFQIGTQSYDRGTVLILKGGNQDPDLWKTLRDAANNNGVKLVPVASGFVDKGLDFGSSSVLPLHSRRVALLTGEGVSSTAAGEVWHFFEQVIQYPVTLINATDAGRMNWSDYDVVIMPDGNYRFLSDKAAVESLRSWVNGGGHLVALENAVAQLAKQDWSLKSKKEDEDNSKDPYSALRRYESRERDAVSETTPGSIFKVELDNTHPLAFGYPAYYYTLKQDDRIYDFIKEDGWNVGVIKKEKQVAGFVGSKLQKRLQDGLLFGMQEIGGGTIVYLADDVLFRSFWENGKLLFSNAVFLVGQ